MSTLSTPVKDRIEKAISANPIMLFMNGTKAAPTCGFSAQVVKILEGYSASFETFNVSEDWDIRQGIKEYSDWPTIPQLYVNGKFVGGCDIVMELHRKGELAPILPA